MVTDMVPAIIPSFEEALEAVKIALSPPVKVGHIPFDEFIQRLSIPLTLSDRVSDSARSSVAGWLQWGYKEFGSSSKGTVSGFCREVREGLAGLGIENLPTVDTLRGWYYMAGKEDLNEISQEDGFGMASACYLSDDPSGDRAQALRSAAKQVAAETGMGAVAAARRLKIAYAGNNEQEWADGLPRFTYRLGTVELVSPDGVIEDKPAYAVLAEWRDGGVFQIGHFLSVEAYPVGSKERIAAKYLSNLLHLRESEVK
jgi:hypothetical protein